MVKSFDSQSLSKLDVSDKIDNDSVKTGDTKSLDPKVLMDMSALEQQDSQHIQRIEYTETLISVSQAGVETNEIVCNSSYQDAEAIANTKIPQLVKTKFQFDCTSPYSYEYPSAVLKSNVISESLVNRELKSFTQDHTAYCRSDAIQYNGTLIAQHAPIHVVPVYAVVKVQQNHLNGVASYPGSDLTHQNAPVHRAYCYQSQTADRKSVSLKSDSPQKKKSAQDMERGPCPKSDKSSQPINGPNLDKSSATLYESASCEDILLENSNTYKDTALNN